jgi:hypothetical protein
MNYEAIEQFVSAARSFGISAADAAKAMSDLGRAMRLAHARQTIRWFLTGIPADPLPFDAA